MTSINHYRNKTMHIDSLSNQVTTNNVIIDSVTDLVLGKDQKVILSRINTPKVSASNIFTESGDTTRVAQTVTVLQLDYSKGYSLNVDLVGNFMLGNDDTDIFTNPSALIAAIEKSAFHFDPHGNYLGVEKSDLFPVTADQWGKVDNAVNNLWYGDGYDAFVEELLQVLAKSINDKEFVLAEEILSKTIQSTIDLLKKQ